MIATGFSATALAELTTVAARSASSPGLLVCNDVEAHNDVEVIFNTGGEEAL